jgi:hypothetical protein
MFPSWGIPGSRRQSFKKIADRVFEQPSSISLRRGQVRLVIRVREGLIPSNVEHQHHLIAGILNAQGGWRNSFVFIIEKTNLRHYPQVNNLAS